MWKVTVSKLTKVTKTYNPSIEAVLETHREFRGIFILNIMGRKLTQDEVILKLRNIYKDSLNFENFKYINNTVKSEVICPTHGMFTATSLTLYNKFGCSKCKFEELKNKYYNYCKKLHNDKYEYYNDYIKKHDIIKIKCPIHGDFSQEANHHYMGHGCSKCSGSYMRTFEEFVKDFNKIHLNKYNYEKNYSIKNKNKINIICPYHGLFSQYVNHHLRGSGCPKCVGRNLNTLEIINNFKKIHGDKFDYSKVKYETTKIKVKIICKEHGIFKQIPTSHLQGSGCPRCFEERRRLILLKSPENFIKDCVRVHGNRYDYSKTDYISSYKEVKIICRQHGLFLQKPSNHLSGSNCPLCKSIFLSECHRDNIEKIILEFKKTHGNKYSYNKVNYVNSKSKVEIICHKHGSFLQSREVHSKGNGCPKCGKIV